MNNEIETVSFERFADFVRQWARVSPKKRIVPETLFEDDLGITGDDGSDLLRATEKRFNVRLSSRQHGYCGTFNLAPDEFLFNSEGFGPSLMLTGRATPIIRPFTVGELYDAVARALMQRSDE